MQIEYDQAEKDDARTDNDLSGLANQLLLKQLRLSAMDLLARREHSQLELETKLTQKKQRILDRASKLLQENAFGQLPVKQESPSHSLADVHSSLASSFAVCVDIALSTLASEGLLDDSRFAESYVRWRSRAGFGPVRIAYELRQKGVSDVSGALNLADWNALASEARIKKYGHSAPIDLKERARQVKFLTYRGFSQDIVKQVFKDI